MASEAESYAKEMRSKWGLYFVEWPPGVALALGDYGGIMDGVFIKEGNLKRDYGIDFAVDPAPEIPTDAHYSHFSEGSVEVNFRARGQGRAGGAVKAGLDLTFRRDHSVFFNAAGCRVETIASPALLRAHILGLVRQGRWEYRWHVITRLVHSSSCTVLVASTAGATASLDANADVPAIDLANANVKMSLKTASSMSAEAVVTGDATPLLGCHRLKSSFFDSMKWAPTKLMAAAEDPPISGDKIGEALKKGIVREDEFEWVESR